jgi:CheY-like chemotaxis protein
MDGFVFAERLRATAESPWPTIMMLSSAGQRTAAARCRALGIKTSLPKPLKRSELLRAIVATLSASAPEPIRERLKSRDTMQTGGAGLRILLAEDNVINQKVAARLLEKEGHEVTIAVNGQQAVDAWSRAEASIPFDLVLMDVQMPVQDGFQATASIRQAEESTGRHITIVAMTAHAMQGDRERCLAAGMDGYLPKPPDPKDLRVLLAKSVAAKHSLSAEPV